MNKMLITILLAACIGCKHRVLNNKPAPVVKTDTGRVMPLTMNNDPVICYGSSSGPLPFLYAAVRAQDAECALSLIAISSVRQIGRARIIEYFNKVDYNFSPVLLSVKRYGEDSAHLIYRINKFATSRILRITTVLENDSVKIVLNENLLRFLKE